MRGLIYLSIVFLTLLSIGSEARPQTESKAKATGSISGAITISGKPASNVKVVALMGDGAQSTISVARTNADGHYHLRNIPHGRCTVSIDSPTFTSTDEPYSVASKSIQLEEQESVEGINLEIAPGAVITGRVTDNSGRPLIGQIVQIVPVEKGREYRVPYLVYEALSPSTDDRGVYRAYGLPAGRYRIKVGEPLSGRKKTMFGEVPLPESYHPGVTDISKAEVVEVASGNEAKDIDIRVNFSPAPKTKTYVVKGRIVDAQTRRPLPNVGFYYHSDKDDDLEPPDNSDISDTGDTDSKGDFRIDELPPGKYTIRMTPSAESPWFAEDSKFEVLNADLLGFELKARSAGSISGVVTPEDPNDTALIASLSQLRIGEGRLMMLGAVAINKDGSFRLSGLSPGVHGLSISSNVIKWEGELLRVEREGVQLNKTEEMPRVIKLEPGENVTGVRVIVAHYTGVVRGLIRIEGGAIPPEGRLSISATPVNQPRKDTPWLKSKRLSVLANRWRSGTIDARGRFEINHLPLGEYEIDLDAYLTPLKFDDKDDENDDLITVTKTITVSGSGEAQVDFVLDLSKTTPRKRQ